MSDAGNEVIRQGPCDYVPAGAREVKGSLWLMSEWLVFQPSEAEQAMGLQNINVGLAQVDFVGKGEFDVGKVFSVGLKTPVRVVAAGQDYQFAVDGVDDWVATIARQVRVVKGEPEPAPPPAPAPPPVPSAPPAPPAPVAEVPPPPPAPEAPAPVAEVPPPPPAPEAPAPVDIPPPPPAPEAPAPVDIPPPPPAPEPPAPVDIPPPPPAPETPAPVDIPLPPPEAAAQVEIPAPPGAEAPVVSEEAPEPPPGKIVIPPPPPESEEEMPETDFAPAEDVPPAEEAPAEEPAAEEAPAEEPAAEEPPASEETPAEEPAAEEPPAEEAPAEEPAAEEAPAEEAPAEEPAAEEAPAEEAPASEETPAEEPAPEAPPESPIQGVHHVAYPVTDLTRAVGFYQEVLGLEIVNQDGNAAAWLKVGGGSLRLVAGGGATGTGATVAVSVPDVDAASEALKARGAEPSDTAPAIGGGRSFSVSDPDGNQITVYQAADPDASQG